MVTRFESAEETRRRLEKQLADAKRDINIQLAFISSFFFFF